MAARCLMSQVQALAASVAEDVDADNARAAAGSAGSTRRKRGRPATAGSQAIVPAVTPRAAAPRQTGGAVEGDSLAFAAVRLPEGRLAELERRASEGDVKSLSRSSADVGYTRPSAFAHRLQADSALGMARQESVDEGAARICTSCFDVERQQHLNSVAVGSQ